MRNVLEEDKTKHNRTEQIYHKSFFRMMEKDKSKKERWKGIKSGSTFENINFLWGII